MMSSSADQWNAWVLADLLERRVVHLTGELDDAAAANACAALMTLDADGDEAAHLQINAAGGTLSGAIAVIDTVALLGVPVEATVVGQAAGAPLLVFASCDRRIVSPRAMLRFEEPEATYTGSQADLSRWVEHRQHQRRSVLERIAERSGRPADELAALLERGVFLTAEDAVAAGLADEVASPTAQVLRFPRQVGFRRR
jgi:ATP-dependent Clp protease protease subunit